MATASGTKESGPLHCVLCYNEYKVPRTLPCKHTFCEGCLKPYIESVGLQNSDSGKQFDCPACRCSVTVPDSNTGDIAKGFPLNALYKSLSTTKCADSTICDVCQVDNVTKSANVWCIECGEALCDECCDAHKKVRLTRKHQIIDISQQTLTYSRSNEECPRHPGTMLELFCLYHKELCCSLCAPTLHSGCNSIRLLDDIAKREEKHKEKASYDSDFKNLQREIRSISDQEDLYISKVDKDYTMMLYDMDTLISTTKNKLDELHGSFKASVHARWNTRKETLSKIQKETRMLQINTENCVKSMSAVTEHASPRQMFVLQEQMKTQLTAHVHNVKTTIKDYKEAKLKLEIENAVLKIVNSVLSVGHITEEETPSPLVENALARIEENINILKQKPEISLLEDSECTSDMIGSLVVSRPVGAVDLMTCTTRKVRSVTQELGQKTRFTGGSYLPDGRLLLADNDNERIVMFDDKYNVVNKSLCQPSPVDITYSDKHKAVIVRTTSNIKKYKINRNSLKFIRDKSLSSDSVSSAFLGGIVVHNDTVLLGTDTFVNKLTMDGTLQKRFTRTGMCCYVAVCSELERFCYSDGNVVVCCRIDGTEIFRYSDGNLGDIGSLSFDRPGNIYVCCYNPNGKVYQISHDGQRGRILALDQCDITSPLYIMYHPSEEKLLVTHGSSFQRVLFEVYELGDFTK